MGCVWEQGSLVLLDRLGSSLRHHPTGPKQEALEDLRDYVRQRVAMTDYPTFRQLGYDCGSGPTESLCGRLTDRLKGPGMRWDKDNAEAMMALASLDQSGLWEHLLEIRAGGGLRPPESLLAHSLNVPQPFYQYLLDKASHDLLDSTVKPPPHGRFVRGCIRVPSGKPDNLSFDELRMLSRCVPRNDMVSLVLPDISRCDRPRGAGLCLVRRPLRLVPTHLRGLRPALACLPLPPGLPAHAPSVQ